MCSFPVNFIYSNSDSPPLFKILEEGAHSCVSLQEFLENNSWRLSLRSGIILSLLLQSVPLRSLLLLLIASSAAPSPRLLAPALPARGFLGFPRISLIFSTFAMMLTRILPGKLDCLGLPRTS